MLGFTRGNAKDQIITKKASQRNKRNKRNKKKENVAEEEWTGFTSD